MHRPHHLRLRGHALIVTRDAVRIVQALALVLAISAGALTGTALGSLFAQMVGRGPHREVGFLLRVVGISILFGLIITDFFHTRQRLMESVQQLNEERETPAQRKRDTAGRSQTAPGPD